MILNICFCFRFAWQLHTPLYFIIMRLNLKVVLLFLCVAVFLITLSFWSHCGDLAIAREFLPRWRQHINGKPEKQLAYTPTYNTHETHKHQKSFADDKQQTMTGIDCVINQEYSVACVQKGDEVFVPFSFLRDYFEIFGALSATDGGPDRFEWSHSNAKINYPKGTYDPRGIFMYFENYNVEVSRFVYFLCGSNYA